MITKTTFEDILTHTKARLTAGESVELLQTEILGRNGSFNALVKELPTVDAALRPELGKRANAIKMELQALLAGNSQKESRFFDLTLPLQLSSHGHEHPVQKTIYELYEIFGSLGFHQFHTPEVETEGHNFDALRVAKNHPARDMQDTFWTTDNRVLRTHTTAFQKRALAAHTPPFAVMQGGKIYRAEAEDATHLSEFHQFDGFAVSEDLSFADLKGVLFNAMHQLFGENTHIRFRPSFFPFVEPGAELDIQCAHCKGAGCKACGQKGWLEMLGCGMTHPEILESAGLDPKKYSGIAFGMGVERITMHKYGVTDIREFVKNDPRFMEQLT